jgi:hypothetical protein
MRNNLVEPISDFIKVISIIKSKNNKGKMSSVILFILLPIMGSADGVKSLLSASIVYTQFNY